MEELEQKLESILGNPQMMQQIMALAGSMEKPPQTADASPPAPPAPEIPGGLGQLLRQASVDKNQQALLTALKPYLTDAKLQKLERAMQAAKMAQMAAVFLDNGGMKMLTGG